MRVFVLSPQRCGSLTLSRSCKHISNYSSGHETREQLELKYPQFSNGNSPTQKVGN